MTSGAPAFHSAAWVNGCQRTRLSRSDQSTCTLYIGADSGASTTGRVAAVRACLVWRSPWLCSTWNTPPFVVEPIRPSLRVCSAFRARPTVPPQHVCNRALDGTRRTAVRNPIHVEHPAMCWPHRHGSALGAGAVAVGDPGAPKDHRPIRPRLFSLNAALRSSCCAGGTVPSDHRALAHVPRGTSRRRRKASHHHCPKLGEPRGDRPGWAAPPVNQRRGTSTGTGRAYRGRPWSS